MIFRWEDAGSYVVAFSTRLGGVSEGPFESLNLGLLTHDRPENVAENRRRLCAEVGADPERLTLNRQVHAATVHRARAGSRGVHGDGLWTDEPDVPMLKMTADCVPIAVARTNGGPPALALLHAGWRGLLEGIVEAGVATLGAGRLSAVLGPAIGPCCYEVGREVGERFPAEVRRGRFLDLRADAERRLRAAGVGEVEHVDLCTSCNPELFFSHRRDGGVTGRQGVLGFLGR